MRFEGICLITDDVPALTKFYEKVLQTTSVGNEIHAQIKTEGASLAIYSRSAAVQDMSLLFEAGVANYTLSFHVEDVDFEYQRLKVLGVEILTMPTNYSWGNRSMQVKDIDGNVISMYCICN